MEIIADAIKKCKEVAICTGHVYNNGKVSNHYLRAIEVNSGGQVLFWDPGLCAPVTWDYVNPKTRKKRFDGNVWKIRVFNR